MVAESMIPWFGGKGLVAAEIWDRIGDVDCYVEPFCGSAAVLMRRPDSHRWWQRHEVVNDLNGYLVNALRAVALDPEAVAHWADWPLSEADLHARHVDLLRRGEELAARVSGDPRYYDAEAAGWWVWGQAAWLGGGWCWNVGPWTARDGRLVRAEEGEGPRVKRAIPKIGRASGLHGKRVRGAVAGPAADRVPQLLEFFGRFHARLRGVDIACGDWSRVLSDVVIRDKRDRAVGILLDPPYDEGGRERTYADETGVSAAARAWAIEHGAEPRFRIALCGYDGEHDMPEGWSCHAWQAQGGMSLRVTEGRGRDNRERERVWFSPGCRAEAAGGQLAMAI